MSRQGTPRRGLGPTAAVLAHPAPESVEAALSLRLIGCTTYQTPQSSAVHQTAISERPGDLRPRERASLGKQRTPEAIFIDDGEVPLAEITLTKNLMGGDYAD
jgi:hypothetical protein